MFVLYRGYRGLCCSIAISWRVTGNLHRTSALEFGCTMRHHVIHWDIRHWTTSFSRLTGKISIHTSSRCLDWGCVAITSCYNHYIWHRSVLVIKLWSSIERDLRVFINYHFLVSLMSIERSILQGTTIESCTGFIILHDYYFNTFKIE